MQGKNDKICRAAYGLKKNENNGGIELTLSQKSNSLKTDKYMTAIIDIGRMQLIRAVNTNDAHYVGIADLSVFRLLLFL